MQSPSPAPIITLLTDFGWRDAYVGIMKGVILNIAPTARLVDLSHEVPAQQIVAGALLLRSAVRYFPAGTVHLAVVDPGVGSLRAPIVVVTPRALLVGPDNGLLYPSARALGIDDVRQLENPAYFRQPVSRTFHGRDIFAPVAAHLAAGTPPNAFGPRLAELQPLPLPEPVCDGAVIRGEVIHVDGFGNLLTNIDANLLSRFASQRVSVSIAGVAKIDVVSAYATVPQGALLGIVGSWDTLEIAIRDGSAARELGAAAGTPVTVAAERGDPS